MAIIPISRQYIQDVTQSLFYYLTNEQYIRSGASTYSINTLKTNFNGLNIMLGYPDQLDKLELPTIALVFQNTPEGQTQAYGDHLSTSSLNYQIHGFVGKQENHGHNMQYRDQLCEDLKALFDDIGYIDLYEFGDFSTQKGNIDIVNVTASYIPPSDEPEVARYQFVIDLEVEYLKSI